MKAIVDDKIPFIKGKIEKLVDEVVYLPGGDISTTDVVDADIMVVRTRTHCDAKLLKNSKVKLIITATIGYDHLDTAWLDTHGIQWTNCPGCNASSVRQYVHNALVATGWMRKGLTAGVVGVGHVGTLVADDLQQCGMNVLRCDPPKGEPATLEEIAEKADIITFHTPLTHDGPCPTYHLADETFFKRLKRRPIIINAARGGVVDEKALLKALHQKSVIDAIIDTWEGEPNINRNLLERAIIATPHIAGYSADGKANATRMALEAICHFLNKPMYLEVVPPNLPSPYAYGEVTEGCLRLYDPITDSKLLKANPTRFEWFRGYYPLRREYDECDNLS